KREIDKGEQSFYDNVKYKESSRNLYNVTLHKGKDPSEYNYMDWEKSIGEDVAKVIENAVGKEYLERKFFTNQNQVQEFNGATAYNFLEDYLADGNDLPGVTVEDYNYPKAVSLFLLRNGIDGIKYPAGTMSVGKTDGFNYVVFDENAVTIEDRVSFKIAPAIKKMIGLNTEKAGNPERFPLPADKEFQRLYTEAMGKDYSKVKAYVLTPAGKAYGPNARPEWTANYDNFKGAREERQTLNSEFVRSIDNFMNKPAEKVVNVEKVFFEGDATLGQKIRDLKQEARQAKLGGNLELAVQLKEQARAIKELNRYSDEELANGITIEKTGEVVKLNPEEIAMYKELRDGYDRLLKFLLENMAKVAFDKYSDTPWFSSMVDLFNDVAIRQTDAQKKTLRALNKLALNKVRGRKAETIQKNRDALLETVKEHLSLVSGVTNQVELTKMAKEMVEAYKQERVSINAIKKARNRIGQITAYAPRVREQANAYLNIYRTVKSMGKDGKEKITKELVANYAIEEKAIYKVKPELRGQAINQLWEDYKSRHKNEDLSYKVDKVARESDTSYRGVNDMNLQRIVDNAIDSIRKTRTLMDGPVLNDLKSSLVQAVANEMKVRGFGRSLVSRKLQHIEGYKTTGLQKITLDYITGLTGMVTKQKAALRAYDILKTIPKDNTVLYEDLAKFTQDMLRNQNSLDRVSGKFKGLLFTWYLSGLLKMAPVQLTQNYATGMPVQAQKMREWGIKGFAETRYHKAMGDATTIRVDRKTGEVKQNKRINKWEARLLTESLHNGNTADQYVRYITGLMDGQLGQKTAWVLDRLAKPFSMMETFNRESASLSMFRMAWEHFSETVPDLEERYQLARQEADRFVSRTHFDFGKENLPRIATGGDIASVSAKLLLTFRSFNHNYVQFI
ncbi:MAG: hypothetical protein PHV11_10245, partial [Candidatus Bipolaricaulis sp.]|nr:hypothetical protein [Candidatus Bipolaricaulis sp.]